VTIAVVGKYTGLKDAYKSLIEALTHGGIANRVKVNIEWIESEVFEKPRTRPVSGRRARHSRARRLRRARRGRQDRGRRTFARTRKVPYFGICFGMQMAVIEAARNLAGIGCHVDRVRNRRRSRWSA
jgi:CTP synthase